MKKTNPLLMLLLASLTLVRCKKDNNNNDNQSTGSSNDEPADQLPVIPPHEHTYSSEYAFNATHHYYASTCGHDDEVSSLEEHTFVDDTCTTCGVTKDMLPKTATLEELVYNLVPKDMQESSNIQMFVTLGKMYQIRNVGTHASYVRYPFVYTSKLIDNTEVTLSGAITFPFNNGKPVFKAVTISSHPTFTDLSEAPSLGFDPYFLPALVGTIVIECDQLGYGISSEHVFNYHCKHLTGRNTFDGVMAAVKFTKNLFSKNILELPVFNLGYSQGGYDSLAFLRYMEVDATEEEKSLLKITKTYSASGAYDLALMLSESLKVPTFPRPEYLLMAFVTAYNLHNELFRELTYEDMLTPLGVGLVDVLLEKNEKSLHDYMKQISSSRNVFLSACFDSTSELFKKLCAIGDNENLLDGNWTPNGELSLYYSPEDELVSPKCSKKAIEMWKDLPNFSSHIIGNLLGKDHISAAIDFYITVLAEISDYLAK